MTDAFDRVIYNGRLMDKKTMAFLQEMEERLDYRLTVTQGCYNPGGVSQSAGTHDGGGVVDLAAWDWESKVHVAADLGAFAYHREAIPGLWGEHVHLGIRDHGRLSSEAQAQQRDWDSRPPRNGLKGHAVLTGQYHPGKEITFKYPPKKEIIVPEQTQVQKARDALVEVMHNAGQAAAFLDDTDPARVVARSQIDDCYKIKRAAREVLESLPKK